jgi:hypothetical protein
MVMVLLVADTLSHGLWPHQRGSNLPFFARWETFFGVTGIATSTLAAEAVRQINDLHFCIPLASQLLLLDAMWKRVLRAVTDHVPASTAPWYRRADVWLLLGAIVLPFGWILALGRVAWVTATARRAR